MIRRQIESLNVERRVIKTFNYDDGYNDVIKVNTRKGVLGLYPGDIVHLDTHALSMDDEYTSWLFLGIGEFCKDKPGLLLTFMPVIINEDDDIVITEKMTNECDWTYLEYVVKAEWKNNSRLRYDAHLRVIFSYGMSERDTMTQITWPEIEAYLRIEQ